MIKKIDILNYITDFRKQPNNTRTYSELVSHLGADNEQALRQFLAELKQLGVVREIENAGQKSYQVAKK